MLRVHTKSLRFTHCDRARRGNSLLSLQGVHFLCTSIEEHIASHGARDAVSLQAKMEPFVYPVPTDVLSLPPLRSCKGSKHLPPHKP